MLFAPVAIALEKLTHFSHVLHTSRLVALPNLSFLSNYQGQQIFEQTFKFGELQDHLH